MALQSTNNDIVLCQHINVHRGRRTIQFAGFLMNIIIILTIILPYLFYGILKSVNLQKSEKYKKKSCDWLLTQVN